MLTLRNFRWLYRRNREVAGYGRLRSLLWAYRILRY
jgi:hypothetical protein